MSPDLRNHDHDIILTTGNYICCLCNKACQVLNHNETCIYFDNNKNYKNYDYDYKYCCFECVQDKLYCCSYHKLLIKEAAKFIEVDDALCIDHYVTYIEKKEYKELLHTIEQKMAVFDQKMAVFKQEMAVFDQKMVRIEHNMADLRDSLSDNIHEDEDEDEDEN
jgi:hypothetical protein